MTRARRWLRRAAWAALALLLLVCVAWPFAVPAVFEHELPKEWGGPARVGGAEWFFGRHVVLRDVLSEARPDDPAALHVERIELEFERPLLLDDPGRLVAGTFVGGTLHYEGREVATVARVHYRWAAMLGADLAIEGLDGVFDSSRPGDWVELIRRIVEAPGIGGGGSDGASGRNAAPAATDGTAGRDDRIRAISVTGGRLAVRLSIDGESPATLVLDPFACGLHPTAPQALAIERLTAGVLDGELNAHGDVDWSAAAIAWHAQANLQNLDLATAGKALAWLPASSVGCVSAFADLGTTDAGELGGAGWAEGTRVAVWELPEAEAVLQELGIAPRRDDVFEEMRARLLLDRGRLWFSQLVAIGEPVNLFGNGSVRLDDGAIDVGLVPRFRARKLAEIPLAQDRPHDLLLDVLKGAVVEVRITGDLDGVRTSVQPVPVVTEPLRQFFSLFR